MRQKLMIGVFAAALLVGPAMSRAQYNDDSQNPQEYNQEDSQPLKLISIILSPVGFLLEWTIARPMHYLATSSSLAPVFGGGNDDSNAYFTGNPRPPLPELPSSDMAPKSTELEGAAQQPLPQTQAAAPARTWQSPTGGPPPAATSPSQQPVLH